MCLILQHFTVCLEGGGKRGLGTARVLRKLDLDEPLLLAVLVCLSRTPGWRMMGGAGVQGQPHHKGTTAACFLFATTAVCPSRGPGVWEPLTGPWCVGGVSRQHSSQQSQDWLDPTKKTNGLFCLHEGGVQGDLGGTSLPGEGLTLALT